MSKKKETSLGMFINDDIIRIGDLVNYKLIDKINKNRFEPLHSNQWVVRKIKHNNEGEVIISVHHFINVFLHVSDIISNFVKVILK